MIYKYAFQFKCSVGQLLQIPYGPKNLKYIPSGPLSKMLLAIALF